MEDNEMVLEIYNPDITSDAVRDLFEEILNQTIPKDTKLILEVVD